MATITFTPIPTSSPDIIAPGRGAEQWHNGSQRISNPTATQPVGTENSLNVYYRKQWTEIEKGNGVYDWTMFDGLVKGAINKGQKLSFGIMSVTPGSEQNHIMIGGFKSSYPQYLHDLMQSETNKDFTTGDLWVPNYNSQHYLGRLKALNQAIYNRILTQRYTPTSGPAANKSILFFDAIFAIDVRGYGSYGEWHTANCVGDWGNYPSGRVPTAASLISIIDAHATVFKKIPLVNMVAVFGANQLNFFHKYAEVSHYTAVLAKNEWGPVGWRKDQYGATDNYLANLLENNNITWNGSAPLKVYILDRWKTSPITGEPPAWTPDGNDLMRQVTTYHTTSFGNGNYGIPGPSPALAEQIRAAFKKTGYRLITQSADTNYSGGNLSIKMNWQNVGTAPTYEDWNVVFELVKADGNIAWSTISTFRPKLFLPNGIASSITETFPLAIPAGTYQLRFAVKDPTGYMTNLPLAIQGGDAQNRYALGSVITGTTPPVNRPPLVNSGADQVITQPASTTTLIGTAVDNDGTIKSVKWERISGSGSLNSPNTNNTFVTGLQEGVSVFRFTGIDNNDAAVSDDVTVTVKKADTPPPPVKTVVDVKNVSTVTTVSTVVFSDGSEQVFT